MVNSRRKGKTGEAAFRRLLCDRDYRVFPNPRGLKGNDFTAIDKDGRIWSVEVKNTQDLTKGYGDQCRIDANGQNRMLAWHPSKWAGFPAGSFLVIKWERGEDCPIASVWK